MTIRALILSLVLSLSTLGSTALADTTEERGRATNKQGMARFELHEYPEAVVLFKEAYEIYPDPKILFNLAQCYRQMHAYQDAVDYYRSYLRLLPDAPNRTMVTARIKELQTLITTEKASAEKPPSGTKPVPEPHVASPPGPPAPASLPVAAPVPALSPVPPRSPSPHASWTGDAWGWALVGGGVLFAGVGTGFLLHASGQDGDLASSAESQRGGLRESINRNRAIGAIGLIGGGALIAGGVVKFALVGHSAESHDASSSQDTSVHLAVGPGWLAVGGSF